MNKEINETSTKAVAPTQQQLSPAAEMIIRAVDSELKADIIPRHKINVLSPSFPWFHRTLANRDSKHRKETGHPLIEQISIGGRSFLIKQSLMEVLRDELSKVSR